MFYLDGVDLTLAELQMVHYSLHLAVCAASWDKAAQRNLGYTAGTWLQLGPSPD